ncbi:MAG TPA: hypothetical protein VJW20_24260 [Candidatus Angelobacter sp.]|nr:hypothetical protein [Candidatus Angelobacter sp.]
MADFDATQKMNIYRTIYRHNASFANIVVHCRLLKKFRILSSKYTLLYQSLTQELQAEINQDVMSAMEGIEADDGFRHEKIRTAWEKEMTDPDDVFLKAEERRREIVQQQRKANRRS